MRNLGDVGCCLLHLARWGEIFPALEQSGLKTVLLFLPFSYGKKLSFLTYCFCAAIILAFVVALGSEQSKYRLQSL